VRRAHFRSEQPCEDHRLPGIGVRVGGKKGGITPEGGGLIYTAKVVEQSF